MGFPAEYPYKKLLMPLLKVKQKEYAAGTPLGITIHYSAHVRPMATIQALEMRSLGYHILIGRSGNIIQLADLSKTVPHAGRASWNGTSPNQNHLAICLSSWGWVEPSGQDFKAWIGALISPDEVQKGPGAGGGIEYWHMATDEQYAALTRICLWAAKTGNIPLASICGHDEAAIPPGRKNDPGFILGCSMDEYRKRLDHALRSSLQS